MILAFAPVLVAALSATVARRRVLALRPSVAAVLLTVLAVSVSMLTLAGLGFLAYLGTAELAPALHPADWNHAVLRRELAVTPVLTALGALAGTALLTCAVLDVVRSTLARRRLTATLAPVPVHGGLKVVDTDDVQAFCLPGRSSCIVVSRGTLAALSPVERRALLAHERSHLRHRHHLLVRLGWVAAAATPLLRPVAHSVSTAVERWADEDAAAAVGDRVVVARAIGAAALGTASPPAALGAASNAVVQRVQCLLDPPARHVTVLLGVVVLVAVCWIGPALGLAHVHAVIEFAERVPR